MIITFDTETFPIRKAGKATTNMVPDLVCMAYAIDDQPVQLVTAEDAVELWAAWIDDPFINLVGLNVVFDIAVMTQALAQRTGEDLGPRTFKLFDDQRVKDVGINERLYDIERGGLFRRGGYDLAAIAKRVANMTLTGKSGGDVWRMRYNELADKEIEDYPLAAVEYAIMDVEATRAIWKARSYMPHADFQVAADWSLFLASAHGLMIDAEWAYTIDGHYAVMEDRARQALMEAEIIDEHGVLKTAKKRQLFADAWEAVGRDPNLTDKGFIATDKKARRQLTDESRSKGISLPPIFQALNEYSRATKFRATYLRPMLDAADVGHPMSPRYNVLVDTGRTSSSGPNIQNFVSRTTAEEREILSSFAARGLVDKDRVMAGGIVGPDIRGCIIPREDHVFVCADYSAIEMAALAQVCTNFNGGELTPLAVAINEGRDLHLMVAQYILDLPYEEILDIYLNGDHNSPDWLRVNLERDTGKIVNYARSGGAMPETVVEYAAGFGTQMSLEKSRIACDAWDAAWSFMPTYFAIIDSCFDRRERAYYIEQHGPNRIMSGWRLRLVKKREAAYNTPFQGLVGCGAKAAAYGLAKAAYCDPTSALYDARIPLFIHDEFGVECLEHVAVECGQALEKIMVDAMKIFIPDVEVRAEFQILSKRWSK